MPKRRRKDRRGPPSRTIESSDRSPIHYRRKTYMKPWFKKSLLGPGRHHPACGQPLGAVQAHRHAVGAAAASRIAPNSAPGWSSASAASSTSTRHRNRSSSCWPKRSQAQRAAHARQAATGAARSKFAARCFAGRAGIDQRSRATATEARVRIAAQGSSRTPLDTVPRAAPSRVAWRRRRASAIVSSHAASSGARTAQRHEGRRVGRHSQLRRLGRVRLRLLPTCVPATCVTRAGATALQRGAHGSVRDHIGALAARRCMALGWLAPTSAATGCWLRQSDFDHAARPSRPVRESESAATR